MVEVTEFRTYAPRRIRVTRLDPCGNANMDAECGYYVRSCIVSVIPEDQQNDPEETLLTCDDGQLDYYNRSNPILKFSQVSLALNGVDSAITSLMLGANEEINRETDQIVGFRPDTDLWGDKFFSLEVWGQKATSANQPRCPTGTQEWTYGLFPFCTNARWESAPRWEMNTDPIIIVFDAMLGGTWDVPWLTVPDETGDPAAVDPFAPSELYLARTTTIAPPAPTAGCLPIPTSV